MLKDVQPAVNRGPRGMWDISRVMQTQRRPSRAGHGRQHSDLHSSGSQQSVTTLDRAVADKAAVSAPGSGKTPVPLGAAGCGKTAFAKRDPSTPAGGMNESCSPSQRLSDWEHELSAPGGSPKRGTLGKTVTGLLASGVSRVLQHFGRTASMEGDLRECLGQNPEGCAGPSAPARDRRQEAVSSRPTSDSKDIVVQLSNGSDSQSDEDSRGSGGEEVRKTTLGNVARNMWQAAHEMLADTALPTARLSTRSTAAPSPSAWKVLLERHRVAQSMPLFSSIPPAAFPLMRQDRNEQRGFPTSGTRSSGAKRSEGSRSASHGIAKRDLRRLSSTGSATECGPEEREVVLCDSEQCGTETAELQPDVVEGAGENSHDSEEIVVWQEDSKEEESCRSSRLSKRSPLHKLRYSQPNWIDIVREHRHAKWRKARGKVRRLQPARRPGSPASRPLPVNSAS